MPGGGDRPRSVRMSMWKCCRITILTNLQQRPGSLAQHGCRALRPLGGRITLQMLLLSRSEPGQRPRACQALGQKDFAALTFYMLRAGRCGQDLAQKLLEVKICWYGLLPGCFNITTAGRWNVRFAPTNCDRRCYAVVEEPLDVLTLERWVHLSRGAITCCTGRSRPSKASARMI
jgi:hypothetical protein